MTKNSKLFSRMLKILIPLAIVIMPLMAVASQNPTDNQSLTYVSSTEGFSITSSIDHSPTTKGETVNIVFTAKVEKKYARVFHISLLSRLLSTDNNSNLIYEYKNIVLKPLTSTTYVYPYIYKGTENMSDILQSVTANATAWTFGGANVDLRTDPGVPGELPAKPELVVVSSTDGFKITTAVDKNPTKVGDVVNITFAVSSDTKYARVSHINVYSRLLSTDNNSNFIYEFLNVVLQVNQVSEYKMQYTYTGGASMLDIIKTVTAKANVWTWGGGKLDIETVGSQDFTPAPTPDPNETTTSVTTPPSEAPTPTSEVTTTTVVSNTNDTSVTTTTKVASGSLGNSSTPTTKATSGQVDLVTASTKLPLKNIKNEKLTMQSLEANEAPETPQLSSITNEASTISASPGQPALVQGNLLSVSAKPLAAAQELPFTGSQTGLMIWWALVLISGGYVTNGFIKYKKMNNSRV